MQLPWGYQSDVLSRKNPVAQCSIPSAFSSSRWKNSYCRDQAAESSQRERLLSLESLQVWPLLGYSALLFRSRHVVEVDHIFVMFTKELNAQVFSAIIFHGVINMILLQVG